MWEYSGKKIKEAVGSQKWGTLRFPQRSYKYSEFCKTDTSVIKCGVWWVTLMNINLVPFCVWVKFWMLRWTVSCLEGSLNWSARFWERRGFRAVVTAGEPAEVLAVLCVQWQCSPERDAMCRMEPHLAWIGHAWCVRGKYKAGFVRRKKNAKWGHVRKCRFGEVAPLQEEYGHFYR